MEQTPAPVRRLMIHALCVSVLIGGCDSGVVTSKLEVPIDDSRPLGSPAPGLFDDNSDIATLRFTINEDSVLDGVFLSPDSDTQGALVPTDGRDFSGSAFTIMSLPSAGVLTLRSEGTVFHYEPRPDYFGKDSFVYATPNGTDIAVSITINPVPDAPVLNRNILATADQGRLYSTLLEAADADGDDLRYRAENLPQWLGLDSTTGVLSGVPQQSDIGRIDGISLIVSDDTGLTDSIDDFEIEVIDVNDSPILNITQVPKELFGRQSVTFEVFPDDLDDDKVTVSIEPNPLFSAEVDEGQIRLQLEDVNQAQSSTLTIVARDEQGAVTREDIAVEVYPLTESGQGTTLSGFKEGRGVHIVILGDGYAVDETRTFRNHVEDILDNIRSDDGIADHLGAFNIHMIRTVSQQSGSDDSDRSDRVDTAFDSAYNCRSIPRLVCADVLKLYEASLGEYPAVDQIILLVNDPRFGGSGNSGGRIAITSAFYPEIALHEMGHSLADLADEYVDPLIQEISGLPPFEEGRYRNISTLSDAAAVPWAHWIDPSVPLPQFADDQGVGIFQGGLYRSTGVYRGTFDSRMRSYSSPFGPVNTEQWILRLYTLTEGIRELAPRVQNMQVVAGESQQFSVLPIFGFEVQQIAWTLNNEALVPDGERPNTDAQNLPTSLTPDSSVVLQIEDGSPVNATSNDTLSELAISFPAGQHQLSVTVSDISNKIRISPPHAGIFTWTWRIRAL